MRRSFAPIVLTVLIVAGWTVDLQAEQPADRPAGERPVTVVIDGVVAWSEHPERLGLEDGRTVLLSDSAVRSLAGQDVLPGLRLRVIGSIEPRIATDLVRAGWAATAALGAMAGGGSTAKVLDGGDGDGGEGIEFEYQGLLTVLLPPDQFGMDDGRTYTVNDETEYDDEIGSYGGLEVGQFLEVKGKRTPDGVNLVEEIEWRGEDTGNGYLEFEGTVAAVSETSLSFVDGTTFVLTPNTEYEGDADTWSDIEPGWRAEVEALEEDGGALIAIEVRVDDDEASTTGGEDFEPQQALVVPAAGASGQAIAARYGAQVIGEVGTLAVLLWWPEEIDDDLLAALDADPEVRAVEPNYLFRDPETVRRRYPIVDHNPSSDKFLDQTAVRLLGLWPAHRATRGSGVTVAVMDTGVDPLHEVLEGRLIDGGLDLVDGDLEPWEERNGVDDDGDGDVDEAAGHGTFVASIVALGAPRASILPYRVLDDDGGGTAYHLALALADAIDRQVQIINLSLVYRSRSTAVDLLLEEAATHGITVVCSAGNDASTELPFPAGDGNVIGVTALAEDGRNLWDFANRSTLVTMAAPGVGIYGALDQQEFGTSSGTSMAAPFVAAVAALLRSADPDLGAGLVEQALKQSGQPVQAPGWEGVALDAERAVRLLIPGPVSADPLLTSSPD